MAHKNTEYTEEGQGGSERFGFQSWVFGPWSLVFGRPVQGRELSSIVGLFPLNPTVAGGLTCGPGGGFFSSPRGGVVV